MKREVLILAAIALLILAAIVFLIIPIMVYSGVPLQEGFVNKNKKSSGIGTSIYNFFIGTDTAHIIGYVVAGIAVFAGLGYMYKGSSSSTLAPAPIPNQAGGKRRQRS